MDGSTITILVSFFAMGIAIMVFQWRQNGALEKRLREDTKELREDFRELRSDFRELENRLGETEERLIERIDTLETRLSGRLDAIAPISRLSSEKIRFQKAL